MKFVGLTNNPEETKTAHGNPYDWEQRYFYSERDARNWEKQMRTKAGYKGGRSNHEWR